MDLELQLNAQVEDIQRRLRDCNFQLNRLRDLVAKSLPELVQSRDAAEAALLAKQSEIDRLRQRLGELSPGFDEPLTVVPEAPLVVAEPLPNLEQAAPATQAEPLPTPAPHDSSSRPAKAPRREGLEDFIGGNLLNKVGIGILILGIGIFVKYAIDQDWIGPIGRVLVGLLSGTVLLGVAHKLRTQYKAFSSVLLGGGMAVMYFSVAIAFHQYGLMSQPLAFGLMCGITFATVIFSLAYNRQEIAVLALLGAFATPFMVAQGDGNYAVLFSYILLVNVGMLVLAWFRDWRLVRILGYGLTILLFGAWTLYTQQSTGTVPAGGIIFAALFFVTFFMTNLAYRVRKQQQADLFTYISLISNSVFFYGISMYILQLHDQGLYMGAFTAGMAAFHFAFILPLRKLLKVNDHVQTMLVGLVMSFATLAIPIQLKGNTITLFWAMEGVLLLYLAERTQLRLLRHGSALVSMLAGIALGSFWVNSMSQTNTTQVFLNGGYMTGLLTAASLIALHYMRKHYSRHQEDTLLAKAYPFLALPIIYLATEFELDRWLTPMNSGTFYIGTMSFAVAFLIAATAWARRSKQQELGATLGVVSVISTIVWATLQAFPISTMRELYTQGFDSGAHFLWHFLPFVLVLGLLALNFWSLKDRFPLHGNAGKILVWGFSLLALVHLSLELEHVLGLAGFPDKITHKVGYPILWGLAGSAMIALGLREKLLSLRIGGLVLFLLILLKLFLFDIREVSPTGRILAFVSLGVLLLVVSFLYQRLRRLLRDETVGENAQA